jgi:23S rRNA (uridine2552-2'-O)-methyltransferase
MSNSKQWLQEYFSDEFVKKAKIEGYISRAAYKLLEIQERDQLIKPGMLVVDLGCAPGGWSQVINEAVGTKGRVIGIDLLPMQAISGVEFIQGDFNEQAILDLLINKISDGDNISTVDLVLSDMAPNISGQKSIDQPRSVNLLELALDCALKILKPRGGFFVKAFQGEGIDAFIKEARQHFKTVKIRKPKASRARSSEIYILGMEFLGYN